MKTAVAPRQSQPQRVRSAKVDRRSIPKENAGDMLVYRNGPAIKFKS